MTRRYRRSFPKRLLNRLVGVWVRLGLPPWKYHLLTVPGRTSGRIRSTPVSVMRIDGQRWLVAPYGARGWVLNARAAGQVTLRRGGRGETVAIQEELDPAGAAPVLKRYIAQEPITRRFFEATARSSLEAFAAEASRHPVFRILGPAE